MFLWKFVCENYNACAIITKDEELGVSILDKFAVRRANQSDGLGARIFKSVKENHDKCFWRARKINVTILNRRIFIRPYYYLREVKIFIAQFLHKSPLGLRNML